MCILFVTIALIGVCMTNQDGNLCGCRLCLDVFSCMHLLQAITIDCLKQPCSWVLHELLHGLLCCTCLIAAGCVPLSGVSWDACRQDLHSPVGVRARCGPHVHCASMHTCTLAAGSHQDLNTCSCSVTPASMVSVLPGCQLPTGRSVLSL